MATETVQTHTHLPQSSVLDRTIEVSRVNWEIAAYIVVVALSVIAHLWNLGAMALHHDEGIHAWASWKLYTGNGGFTCWQGIPSDVYCYDPVYHGPSLYFLTAFAYFLFGDGDAQARLPMAVAGILLVASCWMLRPYLGRSGALIAAILLGFSPSLLYFTRFARHDGLMVLWELWMVIGIMRYIDTGKSAYLYLLAASLALAIGTHELYYILFFIFGILVLARLLDEIFYPTPFLKYGFATIVGVTGGITLLSTVLHIPFPFGVGLFLGEKTFLIAVTVALTWLASQVWTKQPVLVLRLIELWETKRTTLWIAVGILVSLYLVMYTTFFAYPRGALDGLYAGIFYWLGSQQDFARGDQPWYYYLMQLSIYEPLGILTGIGAAIYLFGGNFWKKRPHAEESVDTIANDVEQQLTSRSNTASHTNGQEDEEEEEANQPATSRRRQRRKTRRDAPQPAEGETVRLQPGGTLAPAHALTAAPADPLTMVPSGNLLPLILVVWYFSAIVIFSWAGEKMPWLVVHMALPGNLLAAWALGQLIQSIPPLRAAHAQQPDSTEPSEHNDGWLIWVVPPVLIALLVAFSVALWRFFAGGEGQEAQRNLLQGVLPLLMFGVMVYAMLTISQKIGARVTLAVSGLTLAVLIGAYMTRASWMAVYTHPDVPVELLVYTQTSPDVPRYVEEVRELAVNQTRNFRDAEDVAGGLSMPVVVSNGDESGAGSLAWPLQWYFRDFQQVVWKSANDLENATEQTFEVQLPDGSFGLAPVLMLFTPHVTDSTRELLREHYVQPYGEGGVFNWWFPEGDKCNPEAPGYKRYYFNWWASRESIYEPPPKGCAQDVLPQLHAPWSPLLWPFQPENWQKVRNFMLFRELPSGLQPGSRNMEVWLRNDLVSGVATDGAGGGTTSSQLRLVAEQAIAGEFTSPAGIVLDSEGNIYVSDIQSHRVYIFNSDGELQDTIGGLGSGEGQFNEPRGLAIDEEDNLYVADTWNARIVKISPDGEWLTTWGSGEQDMGGGRMATINDTAEENANNPLGFFGPRGVAIHEDEIYVADTGNKRIVVLDSEGDFRQQWGEGGSAPGSFNEPTSVGVDAQGMVYVADTWNGRVQVFDRDEEGTVSSNPIATWRVRGWEPNTYNDPALAIGPDGRVYLSVPGRAQVLAANAVGEIALRWGGRGQDMASLNAPSGIAVGSDGTVYVVDRSSARVLQFELPQVLPSESE